VRTIHILFVAISPHLLYATIRRIKGYPLRSHEEAELSGKSVRIVFSLSSAGEGFVVKMCELPLVKEGMVYPALERAKRTPWPYRWSVRGPSRERGLGVMVRKFSVCDGSVCVRFFRLRAFADCDCEGSDTESGGEIKTLRCLGGLNVLQESMKLLGAGNFAAWERLSRNPCGR
jgi:hypothetical protein